MNKLFCSLMMLMGTACAGAQTSNGAKPEGAEVPKVYMLKEINSANLVKIYEALGREATGKVAVKLSTGEPGGHNFLQPALIKDLVQKVDGTIVECNTAYGGGRSDTESHRKAAEEHGFTAIAPVDIMDAEGEARLPVSGGKHIAYDIVGSHYMDYDFTVVLSHFKGHAMAGFGGTANAGFIRPERARQAGGIRRRKIFWRRWLRLPRLWPTTAVIRYSTSAWPTTCRWIVTVIPRQPTRRWATLASLPHSTLSPWTRLARTWSAIPRTTGRYISSNVLIPVRACTRWSMPNR